MSKGFPIFGEENEASIYNPEELIDLFLNNTADGICIVDMEGRFIRVNPMYTKIFGYTEEDVLGKKFTEFPNPEIVRDIVKAVWKGESFHNIHTQRFHKNGKVLNIAVSYSPFRNTLGEIIAIIAVYRDLTHSVKIEKELKKTRELYQLIAENTTDLIKVYNKNKEIIYVSPSYEKVLGVPAEEMIGRSILDFIKEDDTKVFRGIFKNLCAGKPQIMQYKLESASGRVIHAEYNITPVYNEKQEIDSFVSVGRNISERIKNDEAIRNLDRLSIIGQLAAGVAHEIRNPLTSLKGFSKLMRSTADDKEKQDYYLSIIMNELERIDVIVNEFMSLAKPQAIQFERVNLFSIIDSTVNILHPQALLHNVEIINHFYNKDVELLCNGNQLKQVFVNFIKNAIEAMPNGGQVYIRVKKLTGNRVQISFQDEGIGIDPDLLRYLGTPFYTTKDKGIGLGLTISNKIIQEHNGTMAVESRPGKGTIVNVELQYI
ncbi:PAS domain-containing sensor histidine kinase [Neobacillus mesonae]|uniref:PAS domain-containing sensor histidine kinase n=1 Tax=Neobacillus mesonae TaxID=1193713 RepID=UPI0025733A3D|nr:PAS domain S-box protein [Neobacillus mesonae]